MELLFNTALSKTFPKVWWGFGLLIAASVGIH